ncbi:MAG TPA: hypothetical protein VGU02_02005 [Gaiellaceae bacterium]|nr:hypothetical protein [Gaiellaceae bacterium]
MNRRVAAAALGGCLVVAVVIGTGLGWWTGNGATSSGAPATPLAARATLAPAQVLFGDQVRATITVAFDRSAVNSSSVQVEPSFAPYAPQGSPAVTRTRSGRTETLHYEYMLECTSEACLPGGKPLVVQFPPVVVTAASRGRMHNVHAAWPQLLVSSRIRSGTGKLVFAGPGGVPRARFDVSPGALTGLLLVLAGILSAAAVAILVREGFRLAATRRHDAEARRTPLEIALERVREAAGRPESADRRKALGHLAQVLARRGDAAIAGTVDEAAWRPAAPDDARMFSIAEEVESSVGVR